MSLINPLNVLMAALAGAGLFALTVALLSQRPVELSETERLFGSGTADRSWQERLQRRLDLARVNMTVGTFLPTLVMLSLLAGLAAYLATGAWLAGVLGLALGGLGYWIYLARKADQALEAYEDELPQVLARLLAGVQLGNNLALAAEHVARFGPPLCREDWAYIAEQLRAKAPVVEVFKVVSLRRDSQLLNSIFELLLLQESQNGPVSDALPMVQESLEDRVRTLRRARTKMQGPIRELWIVCATPFAAVLLLRLTSPEFAAVYRTVPGQILLLAGWGMALAAFSLAYRSFSHALRRETDFSGGLRSTPRAQLPTDTPPTSKASEAQPQQAPVSLANWTAQPKSEPAVKDGDARA